MNRRHVFGLSATTALGFALSSGNALGQQKSLKEQLVGTWTLVSADSIGSDGTRKAVFPGTRKGMMTLDAKGRYLLVAVNTDRPKWKSANRATVTPEEWASAAKDTIAQFGTWSVDETSKTLSRRIEEAVNTPPPKGGGFELRLKAGLVRLRRT